MKTILFPGGSVKNKIWADEIVAQLSPDISVEPVYWGSWETGQENIDMSVEVDKAVAMMTAEPFNIIAKSIGSFVTMQAVAKSDHQPAKLALCGIPLSIFKPEELEAYKILAQMPAERVICLQNEHDPLASYEQVKNFLAAINPEIKVIMKPGDTHNYPYPEDFKRFLLG